MFALSDASPTTRGVTTEFTPPMTDLIPAAFEEGQSTSFYAKTRQGIENLQASGEDPLLEGVKRAIGQEAEPTLSVDELNKTYGLPGLTFDRPQTAALAQLRRDRHQKALEYQYLAGQLPRWGFLPTSPRGIAAFGANMVGSIANPADLAILAFATPVEAETLAARGLPLLSRFPRLTESIVNNATQQAIVEIPRVWTDIQERGKPDWTGVLGDIVVGGAFAEGLRIAGSLLARVGQRTLDAAFRKAVNDVLAGEPVDVSANLMQDPAIIRHELEVQRMRETEELLKASPKFNEDAANRVDALMRDDAWVEARLKEINPKGHLSAEEARATLRTQLLLNYMDTAATARASLGELGHVGSANKRGIHMLAKDFVDSLSVMTDTEKAALSPTVERIQAILNETSKGPPLTLAQAKAVAKEQGIKRPTTAQLKRLAEEGRATLGELSDSQALRLAKELGLKYDWRSEGRLSATAGGVPTDSTFAPYRHWAHVNDKLVVKQIIVNEAQRQTLGQDIRARDELMNRAVQAELEKRIRAHAEEVVRRATEPKAPTGEFPVTDARLDAAEQPGQFVPKSTVDAADLTQQRELLQRDMAKLESLSELTPEEKAFLADDEVTPDSEKFVKSVLESAAGCVTGIKHGNK